MRLTDFSLQKLAQSKYQGEIYFFTAEEAGEMLSRTYPYAKSLLLLSVDTADKFPLFQQLFPNSSVIVLLPGDGVESLFSLPDDVSFVTCFGEDYVIHAARYFAHVRGVPCAVFAYNAVSQALCTSQVRVCIGGEKTEYFAKFSEFVFVDDQLLHKDSFLQAYVNTLSLRLALFELKFNALILQAKYDEGHYQTVAGAISACAETPFSLLDRRLLFCAALVISLCAAEGFPFGELKVLSETYLKLGAGPLSAFYAMQKLSKAYQVFFKHGKYRKYYTPPYHARIRQASGLYKKREEEISATQSIPEVESLALYSQVFESVRAQFLFDAQELVRRAQWLEDNIEAYKPRFPVENKVLNAALKYLPEGNKSYGITSLMRDFGLFDF